MTETPVDTATSTITTTPTITETPVDTATSTGTPTITATPTVSPTTTVTPTVTVTPTITLTSVATMTATATVTGTAAFTDQAIAEVRLAAKVITPQGTVFNRMQLFFKSRETVENIRVHVFTLRGERVKTLSVQNVNDRYLAEWDGRHNDGQIKQGIYVYQVEVSGKVYNGAFVVAQ